MNQIAMPSEHYRFSNYSAQRSYQTVFSDAARQIYDQYNQLNQLAQNGRSAAVSQSPENAMFRELTEILSDYSNPNWNCDGAQAVSFGAITRAIDLIEKLPNNIQTPEFTPEIDGAISFDWRVGAYLVSISVYERKLVFAAILPTGKFHGETSNVNEFPEEIRKMLIRFFQKTAA